MHEDTLDNKLVLVQLMAWYWSGDKPLSGALATRFSDTCLAESSVW